MSAAIYNRPRTVEGGHLTAGGLVLSSEAHWHGTLVPDDERTPTKAERYSRDVVNNLDFAPGLRTPTPETLTHDMATYARLEESRRTYDATSTSFDLFPARGGCLIVRHGLADPDLNQRLG